MKTKKYYRDMDKYKEYARRQKASYRHRTGAGVYEPRAWTQEEDRRVINHDVPDRILSEEIGRSVGAVQKRRWELRRQQQFA